MKKTLLIIFVNMLCFLCHAQSVDIRGTIRDSKTNETLIGVTIVVGGTQQGTVTDLDGNFSLKTAIGSTLNISYVGYTPQQLKVTGNAFLTIAMTQETKLIDELVVVGYSVQKKRDVLGAVAKVESTELNKIPVATTSQALQGRVAGVSVSSQTGSPGAPVAVRIRGVNSLNVSNEPLYIVDGIPVEGALNNISPSDIENMTVLKDASSAAIYGSRASNGVVLITTKSGKAGDAKISYNTQAGVQTHGRLTPMATTEQYIQLYNEAARADNAASVVQRALIEGDWVKNFPNVNHLEEIFRTAPLQSHELTVSGGNDKTQYLFSGTVFKQDGVIDNTNYQRINVRSNVSSQVKKWLKLGLNTSGSTSQNRYVSSSGDGYAGEGGSVVRYALFRNPAIPVFNSEGSYVDLPSEYYGNPVYNSFFGDGYSPEGLTANTDMARKNKTLLSSANAVVQFRPNLFLKTTAGVEYNQVEQRKYFKTWGTANRINSTNSIEVANNNTSNWTLNTTLNHSVNLGESHSISSLIGAEAIKNSGNWINASESEFTNTNPDFLYLGLGKSKTLVSQGEWQSSLMSFFANVNYNYLKKYYLSGILRRDGSSRFSSGNKWGTFFSLSAGWNIEAENFMKKFKGIDKLKLRLGYGSIGNQNIPLYAYSDRYGYNFYYPFGGNSYNGYAQTQLGNSDLKWETSNQFNAGIDLGVLKNSLEITLDYFRKVTNDMLLPASLPPSIGNASPPQINSTGNVLNSGIDLEVSYRRKFRDASFSIALNGGYLHNEVLHLKNPYFAGRVDTGVNVTRTEEGHPIGSFYVYEMAGIFQNEIEVLTSAFQGNNVKPGDVKYVNQNGDNVINANDRKFMGSAIPIITTGLNLSATYKNFDFSMFFQGAFGQKIFSQVNFDIEGYYRGFNVTERYFKEHWTGEGTSNTQPRASWSAKSNNVKASSRFLEDGSYLRMKNVQVGYTFAGAKKLHIDNLRLYVAATNLLTLTKYSGLSPEMTVSTNSASEGDMANGIDWGTYPVAQSYTLGINITF